MEKQTYKNKAMFAVWVIENDGEGFWSLFDTLEDAVSSEGDGAEIYRMEPKFLGKFKRKAEIVKIKRRKKTKRSH